MTACAHENPAGKYPAGSPCSPPRCLVTAQFRQTAFPRSPPRTRGRRSSDDPDMPRGRVRVAQAARALPCSRRRVSEQSLEQVTPAGLQRAQSAEWIPLRIRLPVKCVPWQPTTAGWRARSLLMERICQCRPHRNWNLRDPQVTMRVGVTRTGQMQLLELPDNWRTRRTPSRTPTRTHLTCDRLL